MGKNRNAPWSYEDIIEVITWQKYLLALVLVEIAAWFILVKKLGAIANSLADLNFISFLGMVFGICAIIFSVYFTYNLARSVREITAPLYALQALVPVLNILVLLYLNSVATGILRGNGIRVSLAGACAADLPPKPDGSNAPPSIDKYRVIAFAIIFGFLMIFSLMVMNFFAENPTPARDHYSNEPVSAKPNRTIIHTERQNPGMPNVSQTNTQPQSTAAPSLLIINQSIIVGSRKTISSRSPRTQYSVVFEDDGDTGYFYGLDRNNRESPVLDALHIYDVSKIAEHVKPFPLQIVWSRDGMQSCLIIGGRTYAVFDFQERRGYCRDGTPAPNEKFTRYTHQWSDDALRFFK